MALIDMLCPPAPPMVAATAQAPRQPRAHAPRPRGRKLCVGVDVPIEAGACGRMVHAEHQRCIHCARRRWWPLNHALNNVELAITAILEDDTAPRASTDDTLDHLPAVVPTLDELTDLGDPCLRW